MRIGPLIAIVALSLAGLAAAAWPDSQEPPPVTVTGCVERDAAATIPIFKLIVPLPDDRSRIYQLNAPAAVKVAAVVGKTAEVTGTVTIEKRAGRDIQVLHVKTLKVVADTCKEPRP
jgi:hypothetical protein